MRTAKITISLSQELLHDLDGLVSSRIFLSRSQAIQQAVQEKVKRLNKSRLARECAKLDPDEEQKFADLGLAEEANEWPPY